MSNCSLPVVLANKKKRKEKEMLLSLHCEKISISTLEKKLEIGIKYNLCLKRHILQQT